MNPVQKSLRHHLITALSVGLVFSVVEYIQPTDGKTAEIRDLIRPIFFAIIIWIMTVPVTALVFDAHDKYLRPKFTLPIIVLLVVSGLIASFPISFLIPWLTFTLDLGGHERNLSVMSIDVYEQFILTRYFKIAAIVTVIWVTANYRWYKTLLDNTDKSTEADVQTATISPSPSAMATETIEDNASAKPDFLNLSKKTLGGDILLISAEQHYIRVVTKLGEDLILHRFSDAVREMDRLKSDGKQVHRSFWVHPDGITKIKAANRSYVITLITGDDIPVSRSSKALIEQSGWIKEN